MTMHAEDVTRLVSVAKPEPKQIVGAYRKHLVGVPAEIEGCTGISLFGRRIKSFVFSTDIAIIVNCDADAVFAVYPFTCQPVITQALINASGRPVFTGVAGGTTSGTRAITVAVHSEMQGVGGVVLNAPTSAEDIHAIAEAVDVPVVLTITMFNDVIKGKIEAGARIVNVAAGRRTCEVVAQVRAAFPDMPIMASGGKTGDSIRETIAAGADAISWTPPSMQELQHELMAGYRAQDDAPEDPTIPEPGAA